MNEYYNPNNQGEYNNPNTQKIIIIKTLSLSSRRIKRLFISRLTKLMRL